MTAQEIAQVIWNIKEIIRDDYQDKDVDQVILPFTLLRRLDCVFEGNEEKLDTCLKQLPEHMRDAHLPKIFKMKSGLAFYNTSGLSLKKMLANPAAIGDNFKTYLDGFSPNIKDILYNFTGGEEKGLSPIYATLDRKGLLYQVTQRFVQDADLSPESVDNHMMGTVFEELLRRFNEENNEEAGEHFTPRDAITLLAHLVFEPVKNNLPKIISLYDPACGSGGMLTEGREYLLDIGVKSAAIQLSGTEINPETYAICKSDLIIKGVDPSGMHLGNTITDNGFADKSFGYMLTNPPYGKSWKTDKEKIYYEKQLLDHRFELELANFAGEMEVLDSTPRTSDGQLLFILEEVDKMKPLEYQPQGSRVASIHNGSSLFTGDAGSGESNIRRYLIENDLVDAIIQLPNNIFYNTGISTYVWLLTNKKMANRKGKVQLIDASQAFEKLRKNQGMRNCTITPQYRDAILKTYMDFVEKEGDDKVASKIFDGDDFRFYSVTIERPLRLRSQFNALRIDEMLYDKSEPELTKWLYQQYGERVFSGLDSEIPAIKEYLNENEIKITDKKFAKLISVKEWQSRRNMMDAAKKLLHAVGTSTFMDYNVFAERVNQAAKELGLPTTAAQLKAIARAMSVTDPEAQPVIKKRHKVGSKDVESLMDTYGIDKKRLADYGFIFGEKGSYVSQYVEYESDSDLRDTEKIPVKEDIYEYFQREVRPYVADAWINLPPTKIGCEISFNKYFYKPVPLRTLEENERDILELDKQSQGFIQSLFNLI